MQPRTTVRMQTNDARDMSVHSSQTYPLHSNVNPARPSLPSFILSLRSARAKDLLASALKVRADSSTGQQISHRSLLAGAASERLRAGLCNGPLKTDCHSGTSKTLLYL